MGCDLADAELISKYNKVWFLFCVNDIYSKYVWVVALKKQKQYYNQWCISKYFRQIWTEAK